MRQEKTSNITLGAVRRQVAAMGCEVFEVGVLTSGDSPRMLLRNWQLADIEKSLGWLKAMNLAGGAVYVRPFGEHALSLIDDLNPDALRKMKHAGFEPTLVVQTSPQNYQAWLNHGRALPKELSSAVARSLAEKFGGDLGSADWRHFGRLAGFVNRKEKHRGEDGMFPFVRIVESHPGLVYREAAGFVRGVEAALAQRQQPVPTVSPVRLLSAVKSLEDFHTDPKYGGDLSRADLAYTVYALGRGVSETSIRAALSQRDLTKKGGPKRIEDYLRRTIAKATSKVLRPDRVRELGR